MGAIRRQDAEPGRVVYLRVNHTVGRSSSCELVLDRPVISTHHAALRWTRGIWTLRDLGSRNGTFVNGRRLGMGVDAAATELVVGDSICFADDSEIWELVDASEPKSLLIPLTPGPEPIELGNQEVHAFPTAEAPSVTIYQLLGRWQIEREGDCEQLLGGQEIELGAHRYRLVVAEAFESTVQVLSDDAPRCIEAMSLEIQVSPDEEQAGVLALLNGERHELPRRSTFYLLAFLARVRREQAATQGADAGWVDVETTCRELGLATPSALGLLVHRCRKAFEECDVEDPAAIIDRSRRGQLRIGVAATQLSVTRSI